METADVTKEEVDHDRCVCNGFLVSSSDRTPLQSLYRIAFKSTSVHNEISRPTILYSPIDYQNVDV